MNKNQLASNYYNSMKSNYAKWKKDNFNPGALTNMIECAKQLCELNIPDPFKFITEEQEEELDSGNSDPLPEDNLSEQNVETILSDSVVTHPVTFTGVDNRNNFKKKKKHR